MKTTIEISTPLLRRAKKVASREGITLRRLVEDGLQQTLRAREQSSAPRIYEPLIVVGGQGMNPEFAQGGWEKIRDAIYEGRGA
jgi:hypothetical protein